MVETLAIERAKELFGATYANVQPHSAPGQQRRLHGAAAAGRHRAGMNLAHGGHLTHGSPVNFSGKLYNIIPTASTSPARSTTTRWSAWPSSTSRR